LAGNNNGKENIMAKKKSFEDAMESLEKIVHELESGDLSLEKAMERFEEGIKLSKFCAAKLDETEKKITLLTVQDDGNVSEAPFSGNAVND
jgi:exodeoxyribonuclease VII small subunit